MGWLRNAGRVAIENVKLLIITSGTNCGESVPGAGRVHALTTEMLGFVDIPVVQGQARLLRGPELAPNWVADLKKVMDANERRAMAWRIDCCC